MENERLQAQYDTLKLELLNSQQQYNNLDQENRKLKLRLASQSQENLVPSNNKEVQQQKNQGQQNQVQSTSKNQTQQNQNSSLKQIYPRKSLKRLLNEYKHNGNIIGAVQNLLNKYNSYRNIRGDGNCYFRAVGFAFLEHLLRLSTPIQHLQELISKLETKTGYYQIRPNIMQDNTHLQLFQTFLKLLKALEQQKQQNRKNVYQFLEEELQNNKDNQDEALVWQMRCLTANYLEAHKDYFESFCQTSYEQLISDVLTMGKEADGLGVGPLQVVLKVKIDIVTIDRNYSEAFQFDQIKIAGKFPLIFILYKPGHYDLIYSKEQSDADGFDEASESFQKEVKLPQNYKKEKQGSPFYIEIPQSGQECPCQDLKDFKIQYSFPYQSQSTDELQEQHKKNLKLKSCENCQAELESENIIKLSCTHQFCTFCLEEKIQSESKVVKKQGSKVENKTVKCYKCKNFLSQQEIEMVIRKER